MSQFSIHKNADPVSKKNYPFLLDVQHSLFEALDTRLVIPLTRKPGIGKNPLKDLNLAIEVSGDDYVVLTQQMAAIHVKSLGPAVSDASGNRIEILSAIDFLITGF